jgi:hypothetical protein
MQRNDDIMVGLFLFIDEQKVSATKGSRKASWKER